MDAEGRLQQLQGSRKEKDKQGQKEEEKVDINRLKPEDTSYWIHIKNIAYS